MIYNFCWLLKAASLIFTPLQTPDMLEELFMNPIHSFYYLSVGSNLSYSLLECNKASLKDTLLSFMWLLTHLHNFYFQSRQSQFCLRKRGKDERISPGLMSHISMHMMYGGKDVQSREFMSLLHQIWFYRQKTAIV